MNSLITDRFTPLPAASPSPRCRILFLSLQALGWKTFNQQLIDYAAGREDVEATHVLLEPPLWMRLLNRHPPGMAAEASLVHPMTTWRWALTRWLARNSPPGRFDIVHCSPVTVGSAAAIARQRQAFRLSCSTDSTEVLWAKEIHGWTPQPGKVARERSVFSACDLIAPWSQWVGRSLVADYGVQPDRVVVCRPAVAIQNRIRSNDGVVKLVFVGNDWERKGGPRVLKWHQEHFANQAELHIVSNKAPADLAAKNVIWHGTVEHERLLTQLLPSMDLFVFPTRFDALPAAIIEAVSAGLPVIASRLAGIPEIVQDGINGLLCDVENDASFIAAMKRLIENPELRSTQAANSLAIAQTELTIDVQFRRLFDRLVGLR